MTQRSMSRDDAISLVQRLMDADYPTEADGDAMLDRLKTGLRCPHVSDYIFWSSDPDLTAERVVDRALSYEPFAL